MRVSQSASVSSPRRGNGTPLGIRTRKKHKRLDAISDVVFNRNLKAEEEEEGNVGGEGGRNDEAEVRRSCRVRRAPVVLDSSPLPKKRRRKVEELGRGGRERVEGKGKGKGKGKERAEETMGEELSTWMTRKRTRGSKRRRKRKVFTNDEDNEDDEEEEEEEMRCAKGVVEDRKRSLDRVESVRDLNDEKDELESKSSEGESLENEDGDNRNEEDGNRTPSTSGRVDRTEEVVVGSPIHLVEDAQFREELSGSEDVEESKQNDKPVNFSKLVEEKETPFQALDVAELPKRLSEAEGYNDVGKYVEAEALTKQWEIEKGAKLGNCNVVANGIPSPRTKEGRRCGLCGGGTDGKPPKRLVTDSGGSDHEAYSGLSASEECSYDAWDGFGDEPGWLGKLLGPINDRFGIAGIWVHQHCAVWSPEVYFAGLGCLKNVRAALCRGKALKCTRCGRPGATLGCRVDRCPRTYHLPCARASGCFFDHRKFLIACADHRCLFEPQGPQYMQRLKKLKAKKMKLEIRKMSNDASRKDLEAEEKWLEKCGEDEEFLRRESKRLQRDVLRIAPVYIGGSHSEGEKSFEGWESVAGLQDVIRCMKEVVILPLLYPDFFENMGITPPRGVLLHGYPGTGKTLVVRSLIGSCARGDKRIAYFARKGADCLGKYVGDAERQLRLLFQVAEKSQPSIIFFDEIDGLAPVRTRQQDQTHSSVVSTLLALMDGLKSRGSVIVIGATNRPDSVDPALRRPGRFDREIYFPLPSAKDRAAILALHTRKWPKPVSGPLLNWVATRTVGFAGADLQALCSQAAVIALKRNCSWKQVLSRASDKSADGRRPQLPSFVVEERDWLEALSCAPPPCSRREAGMAANEVVATPLNTCLIPCLLQPLLSLIISLYLDDRLWLPHRLLISGAAIKSAVVSEMAKKDLKSDKWWCYMQTMAEESYITREIVKNLILTGILEGDASWTGFNLPKNVPCDDLGFDDNHLGLPRNVHCSPLKKTGYRILISGDQRSGQKHLASCLLHCFRGNIEMQKIDLATISQEGHGDIEQGISRILMKCSSLKLCAIFMPRIDLWALQSCGQSVEQDVEVSPAFDSSKDSSMSLCETVDENCTSLTITSEKVGATQDHDICIASQTWKSFAEQLECICVSSSLIILATSELPHAALPSEIHHFFGRELLAFQGSLFPDSGMPRFSVEVNEEFDQEKLIHSSALDLSRRLVQQYVQVVHLGSHDNSDSHKTLADPGNDILSHETDLRSDEKHAEVKQQSEVSSTKLPVPCGFRNVKEKSTLVLAITTFGYQILRYPHFAELCWVTSKLNEGPSADIHGPWKNWPFNSCVVHPCKPMQKDDVPCHSNNIKGKDKFSLVRGLIAVGLCAYRGSYKTSREVSLEVRKVLELLVRQISARIQAGKDRYQYIRLLSQVAYLEDVVNNWSHSLRSFEPNDQTLVTNSMLNGSQFPDDSQTPTPEHMDVEREPQILGVGSQDTQLAKVGMLGSNAEATGAAALNKPEAYSLLAEQGPNNPNSGFQETSIMERGFHRATPSFQHGDVDVESISKSTDSTQKSPKEAVCPGEEVTYLDSVNMVVLERNSVSDGKTSTKCEVSGSKDVKGPTMIGREVQSPGQGACAEILDRPMARSCTSGNVGLSGPTELCDLSGFQTTSQTVVSDEASKQGSGKLGISSENSDRSLESEVVCCYTVCVGCIYTLQQLLKKIFTQGWELSGSFCTVDDFHDLASSVSTSLCSSVSKMLVTANCSSSADEILRSELLGKSEGNFQETSALCCHSSETELTKLKECVCHSGKDNFEDLKPSVSHDLPGYRPRFFFRDGVLVSTDPDENSSVHCEYDNMCLCSLMQLIVRIKQPLD